MTATFEEDFELELRSLPGVVNVGINHLENGEVDAVVLSMRNHDPETVRDSAVQVASLYYPDASVILEEAGGSAADSGPGWVYGPDHAGDRRVQRARRHQRGSPDLRRPDRCRPGRQRPVDRRGGGHVGRAAGPGLRHPVLPDGGDEGRYGDRLFGHRRRPVALGRRRPHGHRPGRGRPGLGGQGHAGRVEPLRHHGPRAAAGRPAVRGALAHR